MKTIIILGLLLGLSFIGDVNAQSITTKITRFEVDEKEVKKKYKIFFLSGENWVEATKTIDGFIVPDELKNEEQLSFTIEFGKHILGFSNIHILNFRTSWIVGVDKKPFSEENVKREEAKSIERVYYIRFQGGGPGRRIVITFTPDNPK